MQDYITLYITLCIALYVTLCITFWHKRVEFARARLVYITFYITLYITFWYTWV